MKYGCEFVKEIAAFWASRVAYDDESGKFDINGVMGPDEYHGTTNNNVYTN